MSLFLAGLPNPPRPGGEVARRGGYGEVGRPAGARRGARRRGAREAADRESGPAGRTAAAKRRAEMGEG